MDYPKYIKGNVVEHFKNAIPPETLSKITWPVLLEKFGDTKIEVKRYAVNDRPDLYANDLKEISLREFYDSGDDFWAIKHTFKQTTGNSFLEYLINTIEESLPMKIDGYKGACTLRISPRKWEFPNHFDGVANFMFVLNGSRSVDVTYESYKNHFTLEPGDIFYIPPVWEHHFKADNDEPPIVINLMAKVKDDSAFINAYPKRVKEIKKGI